MHAATSRPRHLVPRIRKRVERLDVLFAAVPALLVRRGPDLRRDDGSEHVKHLVLVATEAEEPLCSREDFRRIIVDDLRRDGLVD